MTDAEVLAVIRERVKRWRTTEHARATYLSVGPEILDDLDPDRIEERGRLREELAKDCGEAYWAIAKHPYPEKNWDQMMADALLAKGWKK